MRGGSWASEPRNCRSADRSNNAPPNGSGNIGFRVVLRISGGRNADSGTNSGPGGTGDKPPVPAAANKAGVP